MPNKSKTKGSNFEREVAKDLSALYNESFIRVANSGAYVGGRNYHRVETLSEGQVQSSRGDIQAPDGWHYFNCECKSYSDFPFHQLLYQGTIPVLEKFIEQLMDVAKPADLNLLIMKFNRKGKYIAFEENLLQSYIKTFRHTNYTNKNNNTWAITGYKDFWQLNKNTIKLLATTGIF